MKDNRPVNLDIGTIRLPITAYASILHRISGVALVVFAFVLLALLDMSLDGAAGFVRAQELLGGPLPRILLWLIATAMIYHGLAGIRHLIMDFGVGESMKGGALGARLVLVLGVIGSALAGVALW